MFGFSSQTATKTWSPAVGGDELVVHESDQYVLRFEPYPQMSAPLPEGEWRHGEPEWAADMSAGDNDESDPQPGRDDQDFDDDDYNADIDPFA